MQLKGKKINILGDSITQGVGVSDQNNNFVNLLVSKYGAELSRNYGISGTRIARQRGDNEGSSAYADRFGKMDNDADIVIVFGGTNDYGHGDAPIGTFADREATSFYGACHKLCKSLKSKYPRKTIIFMTPCHRAGEATPSMHNGRPLSDYANIMLEVAHFHSIPVCNLFNYDGILPDDADNRAKYCPDGLHPNDAGHALIAETLAGFIESL